MSLNYSAECTAGRIPEIGRSVSDIFSKSCSYLYHFGPCLPVLLKDRSGSWYAVGCGRILSRRTAAIAADEVGLEKPSRNRTQRSAVASGPP